MGQDSIGLIERNRAGQFCFCTGRKLEGLVDAEEAEAYAVQLKSKMIQGPVIVESDCTNVISTLKQLEKELLTWAIAKAVGRMASLWSGNPCDVLHRPHSFRPAPFLSLAHPNSSCQRRTRNRSPLEFARPDLQEVNPGWRDCFDQLELGSYGLEEVVPWCCSCSYRLERGGPFPQAADPGWWSQPYSLLAGGARPASARRSRRAVPPFVHRGAASPTVLQFVDSPPSPHETHDREKRYQHSISCWSYRQCWSHWLNLEWRLHHLIASSWFPTPTCGEAIGGEQNHSLYPPDHVNLPLLPVPRESGKMDS
ncbi:hypothetical protein ACQ4PT_063507 [Festuca glaucescens]